MDEHTRLECENYACLYIADTTKAAEYVEVCRELYNLPTLRAYAKYAIPLSLLYKEQCEKELGSYAYSGDLSDDDFHRALAMTYLSSAQLVPLHPNYVVEYWKALCSYNKKFSNRLKASVPAFNDPFDGATDHGLLDSYNLGIDENGNQAEGTGYKDGEEVWWGGGNAAQFQGSFDDLNKELQNGFNQGTPMWHFVRKFFIGATRIKKMMKDDHNDSAVNQTPSRVAGTILGFHKEKEFSDYVKKALLHGQVFEEMARQGYIKLLQKNVEQENGDTTVKYKTQEFGMTAAPFLPCFYAQSPDGIVIDETTAKPVGSIEIKCHWMKYNCEPRMPNIYRGQCLQCMVAFSDWSVIAPGRQMPDAAGPLFDVPYCDFISMFYRQDTDSRYEVAHDPNTVKFTVERVFKHPALVKEFVRFLVTYAFYVQIYAAEKMVKTPTALKEIKRAQALLEKEIERLLATVNVEFDNARRVHFVIRRGEELLKVQQLEMDLKTEFFQNDMDLYRVWWGKAAPFGNKTGSKEPTMPKKFNISGPIKAINSRPAAPAPY